MARRGGRNSYQDENRRRFMRMKFDQIDDEDIRVESAWDVQQNIEASEKLLEALKKCHGG